MPVTPNLAFLENAWPGQEEFTKQIVTHLLWVLCELVGKSAVFLQTNAKMWKMDMWGVCSKRGWEVSVCLVVWAEMLGGEPCSQLFLRWFNSLPHSLPFTHPFPKQTQKCKPITPASAWLLPGHLCHAWEILFWVEHVCVNSELCPTVCSCQGLSHSASMLALCQESSFWIKFSWRGLFHFVWQLLNVKCPFLPHFFNTAVMVLLIWQLQLRTLPHLRVGKLNFLWVSFERDEPVGLQSPISWTCLNCQDLRKDLWEKLSYRKWFHHFAAVTWPLIFLFFNFLLRN